MVQNSGNKIDFTLNKSVIKVKTDFNQAQQKNVVTFKKLPFKGKRYMSQAQEMIALITTFSINIYYY